MRDAYQVVSLTILCFLADTADRRVLFLSLQVVSIHVGEGHTDQTLAAEHVKEVGHLLLSFCFVFLFLR